MSSPDGRGFRLADIAARLGGDVLGDAEKRVYGVATLASAEEGDIAFLANPKYRKQLQTTRAGAVIVGAESAADYPGARIVAANPYAYYARVASLLHPFPAPPLGVHPTATVESDVPAGVSIGPQAVVGRDVLLGDGVVIHGGCVIGDGVSIGEGSLLHGRATVYPGCRIGKRAIIHSGAVIGADGFGFAPDQGTWVKIPQIGRVVVGDDVEIGANTSIDRGALDDTIVGDGVKLDNQIQIGHNCVIGDHTVIAGCVGIAGSTRVGKGCMIGGAAMILGHLEIVAGTVISPGTMVMKSITRAGKYTALFPLEEHDRWLRNAAQIRHLAALAARVSELEKILSKTNVES